MVVEHPLRMRSVKQETPEREWCHSEAPAPPPLDQTAPSVQSRQPLPGSSQETADAPHDCSETQRHTWIFAYHPPDAYQDHCFLLQLDRSIMTVQTLSQLIYESGMTDR